MHWLNVLSEFATWVKRIPNPSQEKYLEHKRAIKLDTNFKVSVCLAATIDKGDKRHAQLRYLDEYYNVPPGTAQRFYADVDLGAIDRR